jgi:hypothetical protein
MQGLSAGIASHIANDNICQKDAAYLVALVNLLRDVLPPEDVLQRAYTK